MSVLLETAIKQNKIRICIEQGTPNSLYLQTFVIYCTSSKVYCISDVVE